MYNLLYIFSFSLKVSELLPRHMEMLHVLLVSHLCSTPAYTHLCVTLIIYWEMSRHMHTYTLDTHILIEKRTLVDRHTVY